MILKRRNERVLERVQRVHRQDAHDRRVRADRRQRTLERRLGVVAEQEAQPRVVPGAARFVERLEPIQPGRRARTRSGADLQREDFGGQLAARVQIAQQRPEVGHRVGDRLRMIGIRLDARRRQLESVARRRLPGLEPFPEQTIEPPDDALTQRREVLQAHAIVRRGLELGVDRLQGAGELLRHQRGIGLAEVDRDLGERERPAVGVGGPPNGDRIAEIVLVVDPVQVHAQRGEQPRVDGSLFDERHDRPDDETGQIAQALRARAARDVIEMEDHRGSCGRSRRSTQKPHGARSSRASSAPAGLSGLRV